MKQIFKILFLLMCLHLNAQVHSKDQKSPTTSKTNVVEKSDLDINAKVHLEAIFSDLIQSKKLSKKKIEILNNYEFLNAFNLSTKGYSFASIEKSDLNINRANQIFFWRMDISTTTAHYEFYLTTNENVSEHFSYVFEFKEGKWNLKVKK